MESIKALPGAVRSSLRSGFIICDLTRIVEELVYNSLDAGASRVSVSVGVGTGYIKVEDDGPGIGREGLVLLGERYATSKFHPLADKDSCSKNFGFLGEALCSISDISLLEIITRTHGRPNGYRKVMKGRKCLYLGIDDDRQDVGTTVIVRDLFYNQPVRRRHIRSSPKKVLHLVKKCVLRVALVRFMVSFKVLDIESEDELLRTHASSSPLSILRSDFGIEVSSLHEVSLSEGALKLGGYMSGACDSPSTKAIQYIYINSRFIVKGPIHKLLNNLSSTCWNQMNGDKVGKRSRPQACPTYCLNLTCPRSFYDLISEFSRTSVEFKNWPLILAFFEKSMTSLLTDGNALSSAARPIGKNGQGKEVKNIITEEKDWLETCESSKKRCRIQNDENHWPSLGFDLLSMDMQTSDNPLSLWQGCNKASTRPLRNTERIEEPQTQIDSSDAYGRSLSSFSFYVEDDEGDDCNNLWKRNNELMPVNQDFLVDTPDTRRGKIYEEDPLSNSRSKDEFQNSVDDRSGSNEVAVTMRNGLHFRFGSEKKQAVEYEDHNYLWEPNIKRIAINEGFLEKDIHDTKRQEIYEEDHLSNSISKDQFVSVADAKPGPNEAAETMRNGLRYGYGSEKEVAIKDDMTPFLRNCSSQGNLGETLFSTEKGFKFQSGHLRMKRNGDDSNGSVDVVEVNDNDQNCDIFQRTFIKIDAEASCPFPEFNAEGERWRDFDVIPRKPQNSILFYEESPSKEKDINNSLAQAGMCGSSFLSLDSNQHSMISDPLFNIKSWDSDCFNHDKQLEKSFKYSRHANVEQFKGKGANSHLGFLGDSCEDFNCGEFLSSTLLFKYDFSGFERESFKFHLCGLDGMSSSNHDDIVTGETNSQCNFHGKDFMYLASASSGPFHRKGPNVEELDLDMRRHQALGPNYLWGARPQRSHSAPPIYRGKRRFLSINNFSNATAVNPDMETNVCTVEERDGLEEREHPQISSAECHQSPVMNSSKDSSICIEPMKKASLSITPNNAETQNKQSLEIRQHSPGDFRMKGQDSTSFGVKWRDVSLHSGLEHLGSFQMGGNTSKKFQDEHTILDIASGILHLTCDSLVPKSVNRNCLEDAKVLSQVDKKFIPVVAGGTLYVIDQHAADERIRLEELRQKVLSGEMKSRTYLEVEKKLVLPETAYQLLYNYAEHIQEWGWIFSIHVQDSQSFKKNFNLLNGQLTSITLIAVPCILGVDLSDTDLQEYLEQLADTDGTSTVPPAVLRVLNYKACRGAIMFGDSLLLSECSLLVQELRRTSLCFQCAHGRPTMVPLVNLEALHKQMVKLKRQSADPNEPWHGLRRQEINLKRARQRLNLATDGSGLTSQGLC
ncbi:hypothetical protein Nepgr_025841 [Nepenthes gracilis]|uniref:DNA mismatch repair protein MLH3 n=1 Tax=Nepenthes gracilis TaxID=150966 RepID=A0AAD3Y021_NEPGR|nr:hypothetical protein Nepgr_025841 [Nepenthes gracilis]